MKDKNNKTQKKQ